MDRERHRLLDEDAVSRPLVTLVFVAAAAVIAASGCSARPGGAPLGLATEHPGGSSQAASATPVATKAANGCGPWDESLVSKDREFPADWSGPRSGWPTRPSIIETGRDVATVAEASAAMGRQVVVPAIDPPAKRVQTIVLTETEGALIVRLLYATTAVTQTETLPEFLARGGIDLSQQSTHGIGAEVVVDTVGLENVTLVEIGPYEAALVHGSPLETKVRPWGLYWSDGTSDYSVNGAGTSSEVIDLARSMYCG
jgi:hypothetical protein